MTSIEQERLREADDEGVPWRRWGPYLSERQWGTVREDYSDGGDAWSYFTHDQARSRAYRWGEDGLAGFSDDNQLLCLALALWNGRDPILKERLFGLTNSEGNHGEDVKEYYFYLDATPTSSYLKMLYKYPQAAFPLRRPRRDQRATGTVSTPSTSSRHGRFRRGPVLRRLRGVRKGTSEDILMQVTVHNRGPERGRPARAADHVVPSHVVLGRAAARRRPCSRAGRLRRTVGVAEHPALGRWWLYADGLVPVLVTGNETNNERVFGSPNEETYVKDGIGRAVVNGETDAVDPSGAGTKAASALHGSRCPQAVSATMRLRLRP